MASLSLLGPTRTRRLGRLTPIVAKSGSGARVCRRDQAPGRASGFRQTGRICHSEEQSGACLARTRKMLAAASTRRVGNSSAPHGAGVSNTHAPTGLRAARLAAGVAPPVATLPRPCGARTGFRGQDTEFGCPSGGRRVRFWHGSPGQDDRCGVPASRHPAGQSAAAHVLRGRGVEYPVPGAKRRRS